MRMHLCSWRARQDDCKPAGPLAPKPKPGIGFRAVLNRGLRWIAWSIDRAVKEVLAAVAQVSVSGL